MKILLMILLVFTQTRYRYLAFYFIVYFSFVTNVVNAGVTIGRTEKFSLQQIEAILDKIIAKKKLTPSDCKLTVEESQECTEFAGSKTKAKTAGMSDADASRAIVKLCSFIGDKPTREAINDKLKDYTPAEVRAFFEDIIVSTQSDKHIAYNTNVALITGNIVEAWKVVNDAISHLTYGSNDANYRRDFEALKAVDKLLRAQNSIILSAPSRNTNIKNMVTLATSNKNFGGYQAIGAPCNTCTGKDATFDALHMMLDDVDKLQMYKHLKSSNNGGPKVTFSGQAQPLDQNGIFSAGASLYNLDWNYYDFMGFAFTMRVVAKTSNPSVVTGFEVKYVGTSGTNRRGDISCYLGRAVMVDAKSWTETTLIQNFKVGKPSYAQFLDYIGLITNLNQLEYWFDERKINPTTFEDTFQNIWLQNGNLTPEGIALFNAIWANDKPSAGNPFGLKGNLFGNRVELVAKTYFISTLVPNLMSDLYKFIKVK